MTAPRSAEELAMRALIVPELRSRWPDARVIHELPLRYSSNRIDLAAVTPGEIVCVEIKSSADVADRLEAQLRAFLPVSSRMIVALAPKWNEQLADRVEQTREQGVLCTRITPRRTAAQEVIERLWAPHMEVWTVDAAAASVGVTRCSFAANRLLWHAQLLHMLHVAELAEIADLHRIGVGKRAAHLDLVAACSKLMTGREILAAACRALRRRNAFAAGTDTPIEAAS